MKTLKIEARYITVSDLKKMLAKLTDILETNQRCETKDDFIEIESNIGGYLEVDYKDYSVEDLRENKK